MINKQARLSSLWAASIVMSTGRNDDLTNWNVSSKKVPQVFLLRNDKWCVGEGYFLLLWINITESIDKMHNPPKGSPVDFSGVSCGPLLCVRLESDLKLQDDYFNHRNVVKKQISCFQVLSTIVCHLHPSLEHIVLSSVLGIWTFLTHKNSFSLKERKTMEVIL